MKKCFLLSSALCCCVLSILLIGRVSNNQITISPPAQSFSNAIAQADEEDGDAGDSSSEDQSLGEESPSNDSDAHEAADENANKDNEDEIENVEEESEEVTTSEEERTESELESEGIDSKDLSVNVSNGTGKLSWGRNSGWGKFYGLPDTYSTVISPQLMKSYATIKAQPAQLEGCFDTSYGLLHIHVDGDKVFGHANYHGKIEFVGKLVDNLLVGAWTMHQPNGLAKSGPIQFVFSENWTSFSGVWGDAGAGSLNQSWEGTKVSCPPKGTKGKSLPKANGPGLK